MRSLVLISLASITLFSCQKKSELKYQEWTVEMGVAQNVIPQNISYESTSTANYQQKKIEFKRQLIDGKPVYNSFIKQVTNKGSTELVQVNLVDQNSHLKSNREFKKVNYSELIKKMGPDFENISFISDEDVIVIENNKPINYLIFSYFSKSGVPYSSFFNSNGELIRTERVGSQFADINAIVYTEGPKLSPLSEQLIKGLMINPTLSNNMVFVTTESEKKISEISPVLKFDTKDERFDQLQAFYYLNKAFQWMKDELKVTLPAKIEAVVHVGYPVKTNSAFYFQNKIRIGRGDDVNYSNIAQDASIVYHESFHALNDSLARLPYEGEGGSLNEAFADFFTCLMTDRPFLGESSYLKGPYKRTLQLNMSLSEKNGGLYHDSQIISSLLWETKEKFGATKAKQLAVETLIQLNNISKFSDFNKKIVIASHKMLTEDEQEALSTILKSRGFEHE